MDKDEIFSAWSPPASLWSPWVKPVLFAHADSVLSHVPITEPAIDLGWLPAPNERVVLVLDLPGAQSVFAGVALAERGYQPVPLYNAIPLPTNLPILQPLTRNPVASVDVLPILQALRTGAEQLAGLPIPPDAPPAFLLDANRRGDGRTMLPGEFDNRSICFTTDFPSANFLTAHGFQRALLVQKNNLRPQSDLAHTLRRWQDGGISLERVAVDAPVARPEPFEVSRPSWYRAMFQRALAAMGFLRAKSGGFGAWVPDSHAG